MTTLAKRPNAVAYGVEMIGRRSEQQDTFRLRQFENDGSWLIVLSDGMGGHAAGALASRIAADGFLASFAALKARSAPLEEALLSALGDANERIGYAQEAAPEAEGMGATLVAAYLSLEGISWVSVGDSPLWIWRAGRLRRLNEDHSLRGLAQSEGPANLLRSALGVSEIPMVDCHATPEPLARNELVVVASDGVLTLNEERIALCISANARAGVEQAAKALLDEVDAVGRESQDNCTVVLATPDAGALSRSRWARSIEHGVDLVSGIARFLAPKNRSGR